MIKTDNGYKPERMCAVCRKRDAKENLLRSVLEGNTVQIDIGQKSQCRGVYLCKNKECAQKAQKTKALHRAFKRVIADSVYEELAGKIGESG